MNLKHHFLLAMPGLAGDYFANSLTYVCEHSAEGAMGLMINRPAELSLMDLLSRLGMNGCSDFTQSPVLEGGPVATDRGFVLHSAEKSFDSSADIGHNLRLSTALDVLEAIARDEGPDRYVVTLGYAGWGAGQLEAEVGANVWLTVPANEEILFNTPLDVRMREAARTLGIDLFMLATRPGHA
jgi:putative transcriptional regulator